MRGSIPAFPDFSQKGGTQPVVLAADKTATQDCDGFGQSGFEHVSGERLKTEHDRAFKDATCLGYLSSKRALSSQPDQTVCHKTTAMNSDNPKLTP